MVGLRVRFRFHGELNDFLTPPRRDVEFAHPAGLTDTAKHVIESLGVPHTEVGRVTVNGLEHSLSKPLADGDQVEVFPHTTPFIPNQLRFVVDGHLGRLAAYLRMLGFDTWYERVAEDALLASVASSEQRLLLTRDVGLLKRREVEQGYCVRFDKPHRQLHEVTVRFALRPHFAPFTRCMDCNGALCPVQKEEIADLLPPHTRETKNEFSRCVNCGKIFWRGSHHARMLGWIDELAAS
ncbi:MAG: Mut7-C ubiquitin/RNAse domain-containing protein [Acidobacteriaceae bacterium]|nr:Mut7-C ubiquitin/RNAse domain-containing protein [Acidobacteriaceae bacterium]